MLKFLTTRAVQVDEWLDRRLGQPYATILIIGLIAEIGRRIGELLDRRLDGSHLLQLAWLLPLNAALLIHQFASLHHIRHRRLEHKAKAAAVASRELAAAETPEGD
jgi:hypothetical protein